MITIRIDAIKDTSDISITSCSVIAVTGSIKHAAAIDTKMIGLDRQLFHCYPNIA